MVEPAKQSRNKAFNFFRFVNHLLPIELVTKSFMQRDCRCETIQNSLVVLTSVRCLARFLTRSFARRIRLVKQDQGRAHEILALSEMSWPHEGRKYLLYMSSSGRLTDSKIFVCHSAVSYLKATSVRGLSWTDSSYLAM